jgi:2-oxoisovalerate dehydrogenase E1 component alpha subunit
LLGIYRTMLLSRRLDDKEIQLKRQNKIFFQISGAGHEAVLTAAGMVLKPGYDWFYLYYRDRALCLQLGETAAEMLYSAVGAAKDPNSGGRQMPSHWGSRRLGIMSHSSPIASQIPHAAGIAYAATYRGEDAVVGCWFGEGATSEGSWHEGLNFSGIHRLPVIWVCENNHYAISVAQTKQMAIDDLADRGPAYGFPGVVVDGNDVLACYGAMKTAVERARAGEGPTLIEAKTYRFFPHTSDDDDRSYRSREEVEEAKHRDPLHMFEHYLRQVGFLKKEEVEGIEAETKADIDRQIDEAWNAPDPEPDSLLRHLYFEDEEA